MELIVSKKKIRSFLSFKLFMNNNFVMWCLFPTKEVLELFKKFAKDHKISFMITRMKNFSKQLYLPTKSSSWNEFIGGSVHLITCQNLQDLNLLLSFFFKEKMFNFTKPLNTCFLNNWTDCFSKLNCFVFKIKLYEYVFPLNKNFFLFFHNLNFNLMLDNNKFYLNLMKTTAVVVYNVMLIIVFVYMLLFKVFFSILNNLFNIFSYANKKSIDS